MSHGQLGPKTQPEQTIPHHHINPMPSESVDRLNDLNYADWRIKMEALLDEKELWDVVSSDETMPLFGPNSKAVKTFKRKQRLAQAKIILHVENSQLLHTDYDDLKDIWDSLA